jgi:hypothetical protein
MTYRRPPSPHRLAYLSSLSCPSACAMPPRRSRASWTTFCWRLDFCFAYLNDIVFSRSSEEHEQHSWNALRLTTGLRNPHQAGEVLFRTPEIIFLGYKVSTEGSQPLRERVADLQDCPPPKTASQFRRFLGMLNFYRRFLPHAAATQAPLHDVLSGPRIKGSHPITWTPKLLKSFDEC